MQKSSPLSPPHQKKNPHGETPEGKWEKKMNSFEVLAKEGNIKWHIE